MRITLTLFLLLMLSTVVLAREPREIVVLLTLEGVSLDQFAECTAPGFSTLIDESAVGLMNNRTDGTFTAEDNAVTISAGTRAKGISAAVAPIPDIASLGGFDAREMVGTESARHVLARNTGVQAPDTAVVYPGIALLRNMNSLQNYIVIPGLFGEQLQQSGIDVRVYGNADRGTTLSRNAVIIAMNRDGWVAHGDVGTKTLLNAPNRPFGVRTNYAFLLQQVAALPAGRHFVVLDAGDVRRAEAMRLYATPAQYLKYKQLALRETMTFAKTVQESLTADATARYLFIVAVTAQDDESLTRNDMLTPVVMGGTGVQAGMLTSGTTRRSGLVTNMDLSATVLSFFSIKQPISMLGVPMRGEAARDTPAMLLRMNRQMVSTYQARYPIVVAFIALVVVSGLLALLSVTLLSHSAGSRSMKFKVFLVQPLLTALMLVPLSLIIAAGLGIYDTISSAVFLLTFALLGAYLLHHFVRDYRLIFAIIGLSTSAVICTDLVLGATMLKTMILSYDPIVGIRFYGLGNEMSGVLLGSTLLGLYALLDYLGRLKARMIGLILAVYAAVFVVIGYPKFGSDFGGMLSAIPGFGYALLKVRDDAIWRKRLAWGAMGAVGLFLLMMVANLRGDVGQQTHIGRAFQEAFESGPSVLTDLAVRKWLMNIRLIRYSMWTYALVSFLVTMIILFFRPVGIVQQTLRKHPFLNAGFLGILVGMVAAMLTNDSGVVMAATGLLYLAPPLVLMVMDEMGFTKPGVGHALSPVTVKTEE